MATIINTPGQSSDSGGAGLLIGLIILALFVIGFFYYGLPMIRNMGQGGVNVTLPDQVDVNVQQEQPQQ